MTTENIEENRGIMTTTTRAGGAIAAVCILAATACSNDGDDTPSADALTTTSAAVDDTGDVPRTTEPTGTTQPAITQPATTQPATDEPTENSSPAAVALLDFEFAPVPAGRYRIETIGAPFLIEIPDGWFVQPNSSGHFVITDPSSQGPGDRDIVMIRPSNLADPDDPAAPREEQDGDWPVDDIGGWLDALVPGIVDGEPVDTAIGGLDAVQFDVAIPDEFECGDDFCAGFATNRLVNSMWFDRGTGYRVWWIDGGEESPIAINIGDGSNPEFTARAEAVLETLTFESVGPNPIPSEGNLWELGFPSEVPAGSVTLPVGPGLTFEVSEPRFVEQFEFFARVLLDGPGEVDIFFPDRASDGEPLATVEDVVAVLERYPGLTATVVGAREVSGYEAIEVDISGGAVSGPGSGPVFQPVGWLPPPDATMWLLETPDGIAVVTAEWFEPAGAEPAQALADEILDSLVISS